MKEIWYKLYPFKLGDIVIIKDDEKQYLPERCNHNRKMKIVHIDHKGKLYFDDIGMEINHLGEQRGIHPELVEYDKQYIRKLKVKKICIE